MGAAWQQPDTDDRGVVPDVGDPDPAVALSAAVARQHWSEVARLVESAWPQLFMKHQEQLRIAFAATPPAAFRHHPGALAVREMLFPVAPHVTDDPPAALPADADVLRSLATGPDAVAALRTALAGLCAMRLREEWDRSVVQADRLATVLEIAHRTRFNEVAERIPGTELQLGVTHLMAGDEVRALHHFRRSHRNADFDRIGHVARDASAKLSLVHAMRGEVVAARQWLQRSDDAGPAEISLSDGVESSRLTARALIAVASLDREDAQRVREDMNHGLIEEELWAFRLHALTRVALVLGDVVGAQHLVDEAATALPYARQPSPPLRARILADTADVHIATGAVGKARHILDGTRSTSPLLELCRGRLALLTGNAEGALVHAHAALASDPTDQRVEIEALALAAISQERSGQRGAATDSLELAIARSTAGPSIAGFATVPGDELAELADATGLELPEGIPEFFRPVPAAVDLTPREHAVLRHLADGRYLSEIAAIDFVSVNTVKSQVRSIYRKLGAGGRDEALRLARTRRLL